MSILFYDYKTLPRTREQAAADKKAVEAEAAALREKESDLKPAARWPEVQAVEDSVINMKPLCELSIVRTDPAGKCSKSFLKMICFWLSLP